MSCQLRNLRIYEYSKNSTNTMGPGLMVKELGFGLEIPPWEKVYELRISSKIQQTQWVRGQVGAGISGRNLWEFGDEARCNGIDSLNGLCAAQFL